MLGGSKLLLGIKQLSLFGAVLGLVFATGAVSFGDASALGNNDKIDICFKYKDFKVKLKVLHKWLDKGASLGTCDGDNEQSNKKIDICFNGNDKQVKLKNIHKFLDKGATLGKCHDDDDDDDHDHDDDHDNDDDHNHGKGKFKHVFRGDGPPPKKLGKNGDLYFDTSDGECMDFHVKIHKHEWEQRGTLCDASVIMIDWSQIDNIPENLLELAELDCDTREIAKTNASGEWVCADDEEGTDTLGELDCDTREIAKFDGTNWICADDEDTLGELDCDEDQIARFDGTDWFCDDESGGGDLSVSIERTLLVTGSPGTMYFDWDQGQTVEFEGIEAEGSITIRLSCTTGTLLTSYHIIAATGPLQFDVFTGTNSGPFDVEVLNFNTVDAADPVEFLLFCASVD